jgi:cell division protease FtsH
VEFGKSKSKIQLQPDTGTKFADVAGCDAAKLELEEVVDFLKNSTKYTDLGAQIPRGVILEGPPGWSMITFNNKVSYNTGASADAS